MARTFQLICLLLGIAIIGANLAVFGQLSQTGNGTGAPGASLPFTYNQGSTFAQTQTGQNALQQSLNVSNWGACPGCSDTDNLTNITHAIQYAAPLGQLLTCQGVYNVNGSLPILPGMAIRGNGVGLNLTGSAPGCQFHETDPTKPIFATDPLARNSIVDVYIGYIGLDAGTDGLNISGQDSSNPTIVSDPYIEHVQFTNQTHANIYVNGHGGWQRLITNFNSFSMPPAAGTCNVLKDTAADIFSFLGMWHSTDDKWDGGYQNVCITSESPSTGNLIFTHPRLQGSVRTPMVFAGNINHVEITRLDCELLNESTVPLVVAYTSGTATATSHTVTVASGLHIVNGDVITIEGAGTSDPVYGRGGTTLGVDFSTVVTAGGGTTTLTTADAIPLSVTGVAVTNAQDDIIDFVPFSTSGAPFNLIFNDGIFAGSVNSRIRYSVKIPFGSFWARFNNPTLSINYPVYDPANIVQMNGAKTPPIGTSSVHRIPKNALGTAGSIQLPQVVYAIDKPFDGNLSYPTQTLGNPGIYGGHVTWGCGDGGTTPGTQGCGVSGVYGYAWWSRVSNFFRPIFGISWDTGTVMIGPKFNDSGNHANLTIGPVGENVNGADNTITLAAGTIASGHTAAQAGITYVDDGHFYIADGGGNLTNLFQLRPNMGMSAAVTGTGCTSTVTRDGQGQIAASAVTPGVGCTVTFNPSEPWYGAFPSCTASTNQLTAAGSILGIDSAHFVISGVPFSGSGTFTGNLTYVCGVN
jgi:hypothetical protein